jgi:hypothetical protein
MIEIYNRQTGEMQTVVSWPTATPHFVITKPLTETASDMFIVTHAKSTAIALGPFYDIQVARICAAVLGLLPMPWDDFSMAVSSQYKAPDPAQVERFKAAWESIPEEIHAWRKEVNRACMYGEL